MGAGSGFCLLHWLRWSVYFRIKFKYCWDKQHDLFNVSLKRKWHSRTKERPRAKLDSLSQSKNGSELGSPENQSPKAASSDGYNNWINKTKTQHPWSFPHISRLCGQKSPFLYPLPLSVNTSTCRHVHRGPPLRGQQRHTCWREEKSLLWCGPNRLWRTVYLRLSAYMGAESLCVQVSPSQYIGKMHALWCHVHLQVHNQDVCLGVWSSASREREM